MAQPVDALGVPGPIEFMDTTYEFVWAGGNGQNFHQQEYLPAGQAVETYSDLFIIQLTTTDATPDAVAAAMVQSLNARKGTDPVVNHQLLRNDTTGEILLDFLISDTGANPIVVEWNAYRYVAVDAGVAVYAVSRRGYGDDAQGFLKGLKEWRIDTVNALAQAELPAVSPRP
jgi:hypothetical protein